MPTTIKRNRRGFRARTPVPTREEAIDEMLASMEYPNINHRALEGFHETERAAVVADALQRHWERRDVARLPILRERLQKWPVDTWGEVFCERLDLEETLTPGQRAEWQEWKARKQ